MYSLIEYELNLMGYYKESIRGSKRTFVHNLSKRECTLDYVDNGAWVISYTVGSTNLAASITPFNDLRLLLEEFLVNNRLCW